MNILVLSNQYPFPLTDGESLRVFSLLKSLRERHKFDLICFDKKTLPNEIRQLFHKIDIFEKPTDKKFSFPKDAFDLFRGNTLASKSYPLIHYLTEIDKECKYDLIFVASWKMAVNIPENIRIPVLMNVCDEGALEIFRALRCSKGFMESVKYIRDLVINYFFEKHFFASLDKCIFASEIDEKIFKRLYPKASAAVVHNGVDADFFKPIGNAEDPLNIAFVGSMDFQPDIEGALYFCQRILPIVRLALPGVRLSIVGKNPPGELVELNSEKIEITGYVQDVRPYINKAALFVCPLRQGTGIKNKVLQAWAIGKAVVATTPSIGGLIVREGENIVVRDNPKEFARAVIDLLQKKEKRLAMGKCARETVLDYYTWDQKANELETVMLDMAKNSGN